MLNVGARSTPTGLVKVYSRIHIVSFLRVILWSSCTTFFDLIPLPDIPQEEETDHKNPEWESKANVAICTRTDEQPQGHQISKPDHPAGHHLRAHPDRSQREHEHTCHSQRYHSTHKPRKEDSCRGCRMRRSQSSSYQRAPAEISSETHFHSYLCHEMNANSCRGLSVESIIANHDEDVSKLTWSYLQSFLKKSMKRSPCPGRNSRNKPGCRWRRLVWRAHGCEEGCCQPFANPYTIECLLLSP